MAPKKKPLTLGKGTPSTPAPQRNPNGRRPASTKPSQAGLVRSAQKTTSSGITKRPDGRAQSEGRSGRQSISKAKVTSEAQTRPSGSRGVYEKPNPKVTSGMGSRLAATNTAMKGAGSAALYTAANAALGPLARKAGTALGKSIKGAMTPKTTKKAADSFSGQYQKGGPSKKAAPKMSKAKSFDNAFASARNSGMKTFVWKGNKYNTKMRGEK